MDKNTVEQLLKSREDEYKKDKEALERVLRMIEAKDGAGTSVSSTPPPRLGGRMFSLGDAINRFLAIVDRNFAVPDIADYITRNYGIDISKRRPQISSFLIAKRKEGKLVLIAQGEGNRPSIYRKA